ncbi:hypothetical protein MSAN_01889000 [Mycena sanguinolenta]|uniref:Uncharacterized protein n=1 Tax=Mycena sanguinolenta TaxID=230812 RepID=A0A8H7CPA4_9AGAR|nr:hypothetical protein MSAN_01889000 [Mycena sanguinolenta]
MVALELPHFRLHDLLAEHDKNPDSDSDSTSGDGSDSDDDETTPPLPPKNPLIPGSIICIACPGTLMTPRHPGDPIPGSVICVARPPPAPVKKASPAEVEARRLRKKHLKDRAARRVHHEMLRVKPGSRLKLCAALRVWQTVPVQINLGIKDEAFHGPVASSGWQAVHQDEVERRAFTLDELLTSDKGMRVFDWQGYIAIFSLILFLNRPSTPTPVIDADRHIPPLPRWLPGRRALGHDVAEAAVTRMQNAAIDAYTEEEWRCSARRSSPPGRTTPGASALPWAGGQTYPQNLAHKVRLLAIFARPVCLQTF